MPALSENESGIPPPPAHVRYALAREALSDEYHKRPKDFIDDEPDLSFEIKMRLSIGLVTNYARLLELKYSRGDAIETLVEDVKAVLFYRQQQKWYADNLPIEDRSARNQSDDMTSGDLFSTYKWFTFALAVGIDYAYFKAAFQCLGFHCEGQDFLLDSILVKLGDK